MRTAELQSRLRALGYDPGPSDGLYGPLTEEAIFDALDDYAPSVVLISPTSLVPVEWMPEVPMKKVITHWTAGTHKASASSDVPHYHILIEDDGHLVRGSYSIKDNVSTSDGRYAAHTKNANTGTIGVSVCAMAGATERPFSTGKYPITEVQWSVLSTVVSDLCKAYSIKVSRETVLSHAEVQKTLGIAQSGKIDIMWIPGMTKMDDAIEIGDVFRETVRTKMLVEASVVHVDTSASLSPTVIP